MKRKAKRPAQSPNTMPPERLAPILDYLRQHAQTWDDAREAVAIRICHAFAETTLGNGIGILEADCIDDRLSQRNRPRIPPLPRPRRARALGKRPVPRASGKQPAAFQPLFPPSALWTAQADASPCPTTCFRRCKTPIVPPTKSCPTPLPTTSTPTICRSTPPSSAPYTPPSPTSLKAKPKNTTMATTPAAAARGTTHSPTSPKPCPI